MVDLERPMTMAIDAVFGMQVDPNTTGFKAEHDGQTYYLCSRGCMLDFQEAPQKYLDLAYEPQGMDGMHGH